MTTVWKLILRALCYSQHACYKKKVPGPWLQTQYFVICIHDYTTNMDALSASHNFEDILQDPDVPFFQV
jgi:hypothetical protein